MSEVAIAEKISLSKVETTVTPPVTPMMQQFLEIKKRHQDCLLFYRMGDFYELFFEDAVTASDTLDIVLTKRGKHNGEDIPMCGVPVHSYESYLHKLIRNGFKVAVCEQLEAPEEAKKRGYKSVVKRDVVRIITSGTITEDTLLDLSSSSFLLAISIHRDTASLAWADISTGEFFTSSIAVSNLASEISRINPKEILISDKLLLDNSFSEIFKEWRKVITSQVDSFFDGVKGERKMKQFYEVSSLDSFGDFSKLELGCCGALLEYIELTQKGNMPRLDVPGKFVTREFMAIDAATRRNLEIFNIVSGEQKGSLFNIIDMTISAAGSRLLQSYLGAPLMNSVSINNRFDMMQFFIDNQQIRGALRECLKLIPDMERAVSRICMGRGSPRDMSSIRDGLAQSLNISGMLIGDLPSGISSYVGDLGNHEELHQLLDEAIVEEPSLQLQQGGVIRAGYHPKLDEYRNIMVESEVFKNRLRDKYRADTGIENLKITRNNILGYFVEVTAQKASKIPVDFIHRQTLASVVRYTTEELRELEQDIVNAQSYAIDLEVEVFTSLIDKVKEHSGTVIKTARAIAGLDVMSSFAELSVQRNYSRPVVDETTQFEIKGGRHPVVEVIAEDDFIKNNCNLSGDERLWMLTGPNMAGKSTFLRQNAMIAIMAQIGCYVSADSAQIGIIDRVFSRVGAADDLARGRSTFMVEMVETATILNQSTNRSLVILDEIGRGTSTFDGLSIAWAVVEHIHNVNKCRALFATHYHELTALSSKLTHLACYTVKVQEWKGKVIFMHEVIAGVADRSYGIHVAQLAGLPKKVTKRADEILKILQKNETGSALTGLAEDLPLFSMAAPKPSSPKLHSNSKGSSSNNPKITLEFQKRNSGNDDKLHKAVSEITPDNLTPREALDILYKIKGLVD